VAVVLTPVQTTQIGINTHKRNNTKTQYKKYKNTVQKIIYRDTNINKTPTQFSKHPHITKQVKTTTVQDA
jgi:hypothetical protein